MAVHRIAKMKEQAPRGSALDSGKHSQIVLQSPGYCKVSQGLKIVD